MRKNLAIRISPAIKATAAIMGDALIHCISQRIDLPHHTDACNGSAGTHLRNHAIQDNVDSAKGGDDLTVPFLNMMNDYYARGISAKTKAAKQTRAKQGMFLAQKHRMVI